MKIIWLGHASFRIETAGQVILVDPWLEGNPSFPDDRRDEAIAGATHILLTHAHFDHASEVSAIVAETGATVVGIVELAGRFGAKDPVQFNMGGTVMLGDAAVTMVPAMHSSSLPGDDADASVGSEAGYILRSEGHTVYISGDTSISAEMEWIGAYFEPDIGILCAGGHFTMDMKMAAWAAKRYFDFRTVIPCHYKTFPLLEQSAEALISGLPGVNVIEPEVLSPIEP